MVSIQTHHMTLEEFIQRYEAAPFELINGEMIPLMPPVMLHVILIKRLIKFLDAYLAQNPLGEAFSEAPYVLSYSSNWVQGSRVPDVMFVAADRLANYQTETPDWKHKPLVLVPDLAAEVISENDRYSQVAQKVAMYIQDGVKLIWVIDPKEQQVIAHASGQPPQFLKGDDQLSGENVISGFAIPVKALFEE